jgi:fatty acid desaturase
MSETESTHRSAPSGTEFRPDTRSTAPADRAALLPAAELAPFLELDDGRSARALGLTLLLLVVALALGLFVLAQGVGLWLLALPLVVVLIASQQHALFVLAHESAHYRLFSSRRLNDAVGRAIGSVAGISMCTYRVIHRLHHNRLYAAEDPDIALMGGYPRGRAYLLKKLATDLSGITAWKTYAYFFGAPAANASTAKAQRPLDDTAPSLRADARADRRGVLLAQALLPLAVLVAFGPRGLVAYALLWLLPALTVLQAILRLRAIAEHGAPAALDSPLKAARTNLPGPLARFFLFPHHVNFHTAHHLWPAVPHYHLPALHARLSERGLLEGAEVRRFGETWQRVYADPGGG